MLFNSWKKFPDRYFFGACIRRKLTVIKLLNWITKSQIVKGFFQFVADLLEELRSNTGLDVEVVTLTNWASNVEKSQLYRIQPETREHVSQVVSLSRQHETRVRVAGATHSFSDLFPDSGSVWIDLSQFGLNDEDRLFISYAVRRQTSDVTLFLEYELTLAL